MLDLLAPLATMNKAAKMWVCKFLFQILIAVLGDTHPEERLWDGRIAFEPNLGLLKAFRS